MLETLLLEPTNRVDHRARSVAWKAAKRQHAAMREQAAELSDAAMCKQWRHTAGMGVIEGAGASGVVAVVHHFAARRAACRLDGAVHTAAP